MIHVAAEAVQECSTRHLCIGIILESYSNRIQIVFKSYPNRIQIVFEVYAWTIGEFPRCNHLRIAPCILDGIQFVSIMCWKCMRIYTRIPETYRYCMQPHKRNSGAFPAFHRLGKSWDYSKKAYTHTHTPHWGVAMRYTVCRCKNLPRKAALFFVRSSGRSLQKPCGGGRGCKCEAFFGSGAFLSSLCCPT